MPEISLPHNWQPREYQKPAWESWLGGCNFQALNWHRRAGKDDINLRQHAVGAFNRVGTYWHMLPQYSQARKAIWDAVNPHTGKKRIDEAFPLEIRKSTRNNDMFIEFVNGSTWQVVGSDAYNSLVGTPPIGLTFSEFALANPSAWAYLSPIILENGGWVSFISTGRGNNHFKGLYDAAVKDPDWFAQTLTVDDTGAVPVEAIEKQRTIYQAMFGIEQANMLIEQEFYGSWLGGLVGAYFGAEMNKAEREGRVCEFEIDWKQPVHTAWDLGKAVNNPIWCFQVINGEPRIVDFYQPESEDLADWVTWLNDKGYGGNDYVPHDILVTEWGSSRTRYDTLKGMGRNPRRLPRVSVADGLQAARTTINAARFRSTDRVRDGIEGLKNYRREWDDERKTFREVPVKDWAEHIGSAFRYLGLAWKEVKPPEPKKEKPKELVYEVDERGQLRGNMSVKDWVEQRVKQRRANG